MDVYPELEQYYEEQRKRAQADAPATAPVCTAVRADGEPCWLRVHDSWPHLTRDFSWFTLPDSKWTNADLRGGELREAPATLRAT